MEDTFLPARPFGCLTISLIKVQMDNSDRVTSACLYYVSFCRSSKSQRGRNPLIAWLQWIPLKAGWEKRRKTYLNRLWTKYHFAPRWIKSKGVCRHLLYPLPHPKITLRQSCKYLYQVFINGTLDRFSQTFRLDTVQPAGKSEVRET